MTKIKPIKRFNFKHFHSITSRWMDNDIYGHINNVTYYSYFDTAVNHYLIDAADFDIHKASVVGYVVHSECNYLSSIAFPDSIEVGLKVNRIGNSSVTYDLALFKNGEAVASAQGVFVQVFVDRKHGRPVTIPNFIRSALELLC